MVALMVSRDFICDTLATLPVWLWPVFLWEVFLVGYASARNGRIYITLDVRGDRKDTCDWTAFAARTPWERLGPEQRAAALLARAGEGFALIALASGLCAALAGQAPGLAGLPFVMVPP
mgnify:CR=1 FL=1